MFKFKTLISPFGEVGLKYMRLIKSAFFAAALLAAIGGNFNPASAQAYYGRTPSLSVSQEGTGGSMRVNVSNADTYSKVVLYARPSGSTSWSTVVDPIGQTDSGGYLNTLTYLGSGLAEFYVSVNGAQSNTAYLYGGGSGCSYNCGNPYNLSLSQNSVSLNVGQTSTVTAYNSGNSIYVSSNSNSYVVSASVSGNQINLYGLTNGSSTISVCSSGYTYAYFAPACASIYVTVSGSSQGGNIWFSPSNPTMYMGQSLAVSVNSSVYASNAYGSNAYYISSNSNSGVVSASISGTVLNLYANQSGSATISVCHSSLNFCSSIYVTVTGTGGTGQMTFSPANPSLAIGQSLAVSIFVPYMYSGNFYVASNSNSGVVSASISGSVLNLYGLSQGSSNISVCQSSGSCGNLFVNVTGGSGYGNVWFSPSSVNMTSGQATNVYIYSSNNYSGGYYVSSGGNSFTVSTSLSGNQLNLTAQNQGSVNLVICQSVSSNVCGTLSVSVSGGNWNNNLTFSQNSLNLASGQSANVTVYGNGSYYVASNSNSGAASASLTGNNLYIYANNFGNSAIVVCQNSPYACGTVMVNVSGSNSGGNLYFSISNLPNMYIGQYYNQQLQAYGGTAPYTFQLTSGQLPAGLYLTTGGMIYGTPQNTSYANFTVRVNDAYGRSATANFNIGNSGGGVLGSSTYPNGQLIKENGTVYIVYRGQKSGFASGSVFTGFGFKFSNVLTTGYTNLPNTGYIINNPNTSHPWGAWVLSGQTIYFVHEQGLIPVPSWDMFVNNRGNSSLVVPANMYDFQRPILTPLVVNDSRLY